MEFEQVDRGTVRAAIALATRAPSVHNSQPWRWWFDTGTVHLYVDMGRWLPLTDTDGRDLLLSCGAALHHLRVALAALGIDAIISRLPDPDQPDLLAEVELRPRRGRAITAATSADVEAVPLRRTDRRSYSSWPLPTAFLEAFTERAADHGALLRPIMEPGARAKVASAAATAAARHAATPGYLTELAMWSGRHASADGVPAVNSWVGAAGRGTPARHFADHGPTGWDDVRRPDGATLLVLATSSDDELSQLRAGEALSAVLLHATSLGLSSCSLTETLEIEQTRTVLREEVLAGSMSPQVLLRLGWSGAVPLPATPRRPLDDQIDLREPNLW